MAGLGWEAILAIGLVAILAFFVTAAFFPALLIAIIFLVGAGLVGIFGINKMHPTASLAVVLVLILLAAIFAFVQVGQQASLSLAGGLHV
ncbi:MAG: hypothetical protein ACREDE_10365 [Thermoplasmata archaeon]